MTDSRQRPRQWRGCEGSTGGIQPSLEDSLISFRIVRELIHVSVVLTWTGNIDLMFVHWFPYSTSLVFVNGSGSPTCRMSEEVESLWDWDPLTNMESKSVTRRSLRKRGLTSVSRSSHPSPLRERTIKETAPWEKLRTSTKDITTRRRRGKEKWSSLTCPLLNESRYVTVLFSGTYFQKGLDSQEDLR